MNDSIKQRTWSEREQIAYLENVLGDIDEPTIKNEPTPRATKTPLAKPLWLLLLFIGISIGWFLRPAEQPAPRVGAIEHYVSPAELNQLWPLAQLAADREKMRELIAETHSAAAILAHSAPSAEETGQISDEQWQWLKRKNLHAPEQIWTSKSLDAEEQESSFTTWSYETPHYNLDARSRVVDWIRSGNETLDVIVTNQPTGAQYRVQGDRYEDGIDARVTFVGNLNW